MIQVNREGIQAQQPWCLATPKSKLKNFSHSREKLFTVKVGQWNRLPRETLDIPLLEVFRARLGSLGLWKVSPAHGKGTQTR